ncbi:TetR/AcrR family transcriptional regulator [Spiractinospora alimapuensis]|uniref:TetR/AcrR family transcriptional regulator n=1 Tax=Spiractinospora alimapuensis TaxID=2820884 RepID=UPI001F329E31|nr:TetR/AcrR family transcriptional regulator [Spiractinospora alimapuensis]QVQ51958.1 TetR/AcrR family transcriptional regulator [Spiractinospora alimapuensis]
MTGRTVRDERATATRERILAAAVRLFAEHGVTAVSNRQVSEAAGQGNNTSVSYHFGGKADLVRAIVRRHNEEIEVLRGRMVARVSDNAGIRDWVACLVRPPTQYLAELGPPTWFARFNAQICTDPAFREIVAEESRSAPALRTTLERLRACLPDLPPGVREERGAMTRQLMLHAVAERELALAEGLPTARASWDDATTGLIDAITGLWLAPTSHEHP